MAALYGVIESGGTKCVCAVADASGRFLHRHVVATAGPRETFSEIRNFFQQAVPSGEWLKAVGVAAFGPVGIDPDAADYGVVGATPKPGWTGASYPAALAALDAPLVIDSDVNGAALGEWMQGAGRNCRTLAYVTVGTGIGVGVLHDGSSRNGFGHYEMGHIYPPHDRMADPFPGNCPFHGNCLEGLASGPAIKARWGQDLSALAATTEALDLQAEYLSYLMVTVILTHMPDRIVIGGGVSKTAGLLRLLRRKTSEKLGGYVAFKGASDALDDIIVRPRLGDDAAMVGAFHLALRRD